MRGRKSGPVTPKSESDAELNYARQKVASWLMRALDMRVAMDEEFFRCLFWVLGEGNPCCRKSCVPAMP